MKVKATSSGTPPLSGAEAFARLLVAATEKKPVLRVVDGDKIKPRQIKARTGKTWG